MKADEVAKKALDGIKSGSFIVPCNFEGHMLAIATAGLSPQRSFLMAFIEVVFSGILRLAGLFFQWNWYGSIEKWHAKKNGKYALKDLSIYTTGGKIQTMPTLLNLVLTIYFFSCFLMSS